MIVPPPASVPIEPSLASAGPWAYTAPCWLPGGNSQTIWAALCARRHLGPPPRWARQRWTTPDGDFIDVDLTDHPVPERAPLLVLFHGLEGSSSSQYAVAFADFAAAHHIRCAVPHFRGCSGELNWAPRAYHSGDYAEIDWILARFAAEHPCRPLIAVGVSLGGNALLRWAGETGSGAHGVKAVAAVSSPLDLAAGGHAIGRGFNRVVYNRMFLASMRPKALKKLEQHPGLFDRQALLAARDLYAFDNVFTAPVHGFRDANDYWARASAKPWMKHIQLPALALNARNDPFIPAESLPRSQEVSRWVTLWQPEQGGHVGFTRPLNRVAALPGLPGHVRAMPNAVGRWLLQHI